MGVSSYITLTKPKLSFLLLLTAIVEGLALYTNNGDGVKLLILSLSVMLSCMGANALTCYLDRDIDSIMQRTKNRPIPKGEISPKNALLFGSLLLIFGMIMAVNINYYVLLWGVIGVVFVLTYNSKLKRLTPYNILIASPAGAMPILGAYSAMTNNLISIQSTILALLIIFWTPIHIWSLALFYKDDYKKANIPMLPVVKDEKVITKLLWFFTLLYITNGFIIFLTLKPIWISLFLIALLNYPLIKLLRVNKIGISNHYKLFKLSNTHLGVVFICYLLLSTLYKI